ncbi:GGDEF domain-containing protein [Agathobacter sp.]|uniref:GGDEF domain-containing protein n=1 Tax=Agathobacter sp. TaxID=2021311 RepID=UPI00280B5914|nr:GGDEF domain-containing protein [Agathobacter sp.]
MGNNFNTVKEQRFLFNVNKIFLVIHLMMLFLFSSLGIELMAGISLLSICFYFLAFSLAASEKLSIYVYSVAIEILINMVLAVVCLGLVCNFQLFLIDAMFLIFAMDYVVLRKKNKNHVAILFCCVYAIALILLYTIDGLYTPLYKLNPIVLKSISIAILSFAVILIIICMMYLLQFMSSEEGAMEKQAQFDALTELPNRFYMMAQLKNLFEADRQREYFLAMIDIDDFKKINDTYGHNVGDDALRVLSRTIVNKARGTGLMYCRWGGEEFLLLGKCVDGEVPKDYLDELREEIHSKTIWTSKGSGRMTVTIGAGKYKVGQDYKEWINFVDKQLYVGKCTGKNKVVC